MDCFRNERTVKLKFILLTCCISLVLLIYRESALSIDSLRSLLEESSELDTRIFRAFLGYLVIFFVFFMPLLISDWASLGSLMDVLFLLSWGEQSGLDPETFLSCGRRSRSLARGAFSSWLCSMLSSSSLFFCTDMWRVY